MNKKQDETSECIIVLGSVVLCLMFFALLIGIGYVEYESGYAHGQIAERCNQGTVSPVLCNWEGYAYKGRQFNQGK